MTEDDDLNVWRDVCRSCTLTHAREKHADIHMLQTQKRRAPISHMPPIAFHTSYDISELDHTSFLQHTNDSSHEQLPSRTEITPVYGLKSAATKTLIRRLRSGAQHPEGTIDLHGLNTDSAMDALHAYIRIAAVRGQRTILIITGKGSGILKTALPRMLEHHAVSRLVICYEQAAAPHGGTGAFYAILRTHSSLS